MMINLKNSSVALTASIISWLLLPGCTTFSTGAQTLTQFIEGKSADDQLALAKLKEKQGDLEEADQTYRDVLKGDPKNAEALHRAAVLATKRNQMEKAESQFKEALALGSPSAKLWNDYGYHCFLKGDNKTAESCFRKALSKDSEFTPAWTNLGLALADLDRFEEARLAFQNATKSPAEIHNNMGFVYAKKKLFELSQSEFIHALEVEPDNVVAAEGLLQVSSKIPGKEPLTVVKTVGAKRSEPMEDPTQETQLSLTQVSTLNNDRLLPPVVRAGTLGERKINDSRSRATMVSDSTSSSNDVVESFPPVVSQPFKPGSSVK